MKIIELPDLKSVHSFDDLAGRWNVTSGYNCIDFNWHFLAPFSALWAPEFPELEESERFQSDVRLIRAFFNRTFLPAIMDCHGSCIGELRSKDETGLVAVPGDNTVDLVGILYKIDNNGETFFCYKEGYARVTDSIIKNINGSQPPFISGSLHVKKSASF